MDLLFVQTNYLHWAKNSGYHQFIKYLPLSYRIYHKRVNSGPSWLFALPIINKISLSILRTLSDINGYYTFNDLIAEMRTLSKDYVNKYDVIHFMDGEQGFSKIGYKYLERCPKRKSRIVVTYHQPPDILRVRIKNEKILAAINHIVVVGSKQIEYLSDYVEMNKISFIHHGVDTDYFCPKPEEKKNNKHVICLFVGRWLRDFSLLEQVVYKLRNNKNIHFYIVATSNEYKYFQNLSNVTYYQRISDSNLLSLYQKADILTMPLVDSTANNVILESMACGLPIITTNVGSIRDYVNEEYALIIPPGNVNEFSEAIMSLVDNELLRKKMGFAGRMAAVKYYKWEFIARKYELIYKQVVF